MCGVVGFWSFRPPSAGCAAIAERMADALVHRGPDHRGTWADEGAGISIGHRRLSIIDLSPAGHQPMVSACGRYVLTFNGEIYNHQELRTTLERERIAPVWRGHSDTETLLAAIAAWGLASALKQSVGMFALGVWDRHTETLQLARDRLGEKPLYYAWVPGGMAFASEVKAFASVPGFSRIVDRDVLALYMQFGNVPAPHGIFNGLHKVMPGTILTLPKASLDTHQPTAAAYWSLHDVAREGLRHPFHTEADALRDLEVTLGAAIAAQSIADVPLGAFLSGGVDSSLIAALMQAQSNSRIQTYTIGFDETAYDESFFARAVAQHLGTEHHEVRLRADDALAVIPQIPDIYDEPFADSSQIPTHLVCKMARGHVKVALSGDGGDELFGGYNRYFWSRKVVKYWCHIPLFLRVGGLRALRGVSARTFDGVGAALGVGSRVSHLGFKVHKLLQRLEDLRGSRDIHRLLLTEWPQRSGIVLGANPLRTLVDDLEVEASAMELEQFMMLVDSLTYLPNDVLTKVDRAAMSVSLETRAPYLDHRVVETAWRLPLSMKLRDGRGKWALRQILYKHVPKELIDRPKSGFAVPLAAWLRGPLRGWAESLLDTHRLAQEGYLDVQQVRTAWQEHVNGTRDWTQRLWYVLTFESWLQRNR